LKRAVLVLNYVINVTFVYAGKYRKRKAMDSGTPGTVRPGDTGANTSQSSKTGRPKAIVRDSFVKKIVNGKKLNLCKLCKTHVSDKADRMLKHLEKCPQSIELVVPKSSNDVPESANELKNEVRKIKQPKITEMIQLMIQLKKFLQKE